MAGIEYKNDTLCLDKLDIGVKYEHINDIEGRHEITLDSEDKVVSYRKEDGTFVENAGIETTHLNADSLVLSKEGMAAFEKILKEDGIADTEIKKNYFLPKFGKVNIKEEVFYLANVEGVSSLEDVHVLQVLDDNSANATLRVPISRYFRNGTDTYVMSFASSDVKLVDGSYVATVEVVKRNGKVYYSSTVGTANGSTDIRSVVIENYSIETENDETMTEGQTKKVEVSVVQVTGIPNIDTWEVHKKREHYCLADIDFGTYLTKNNVPVGIKYQGSYSTSMRKRGLRLTFYKNDTYAKKDKKRIGEMLRLSGYNLKSYFQDSARIKDAILNNLLIEISELKGQDAYPWSKDSVPYNGATGLIKSFPIETWFGEAFYGLQFFGLKKDEKNFMLDGDDDSSGIYVSGAHDGPATWTTGDHTWFEDEMMDDMSQETADALDEFFKYAKGFIEGTINIDGADVDFTNDMLEEHIDLKSWIDYWIIIQVFLLWDNTFHNIILHTRADKKKFYAFIYDADNVATGYGYDGDLIVKNEERSSKIDMSFWAKFVDEYKDNILTRYYELRKSVLTVDNIRAIYKAYISNIPASVVNEDNAKWGTNWPITSYESFINFLDKRLNWLDETYFNL